MSVIVRPMLLSGKPLLGVQLALSVRRGFKTVLLVHSQGSLVLHRLMVLTDRFVELASRVLG